MTNDEAITKALIRLQMLCETVRRNSFYTVSPMYVGEYEDILQQFSLAEVNVDGFAIPESAMPGLPDGERNCLREFFVMRLAGLLMHLSKIASTGSVPNQQVAERIILALQPTEDDPPF